MHKYYVFSRECPNAVATFDEIRGIFPVRQAKIQKRVKKDRMTSFDRDVKINMNPQETVPKNSEDPKNTSSDPRKGVQFAVFPLPLPEGDDGLFAGKLVARSFPVSSLLESVPEAQRLVACTRDDRLSVRTHGEVKHTQGVPGQCRDGAHAGILPQANLVRDGSTRVTVGGDDLVRVFGPHQVTHLELLVNVGQLVCPNNASDQSCSLEIRYPIR